ncbi:MAG TPA: AAA family ATPase, partial [Bradyrhizobium sp.]
MTASRIHRLTLTHFRNYRAAQLATRGDVVVLVGPNGAGKTNCIEAISFLSPGRGLRRATLEDVADNQGDGSWAVSAEVEGALGLATLGTGIDAPDREAPTT